ncbi:BLUF domain-containing protein [Paracoccus shandongensis]|uniref:BLUF domain-containing protein n=1 Tax=Paracoccus shandongensis TaxID=2816048 RepID=UPI001A8D171B|nr:BLUF domain-containing protein [Paracoccus shandongensis]
MLEDPSAERLDVQEQFWKPVTEDRLGYCLYRSLAQPGLADDQLERIIDRSRQRNRSNGLTGCLHYENGVFFQWLEGPWRQVFRLLDALRDDDRHMDMTILDQGSLDRRLFPDWKMRFSDRRAASLFDWLADWNSRPDDEGAYAERVGVFLRSIKAEGPGNGA